MAQWRREDRTLHAKIVYYGPAMGGKTANLEALHRMADARGAGRLLSTQTTDDRTLFFDLLKIELPDLLGYKVAINLFTVPGQVRYDTARQMVLSGADAIVFVADSSVGREEQNRWSIQNLQMNMRARRLDPARVPLIYQFNKQDMPDAAEPHEVASWIRVQEDDGIAAVATEGRGVLETFAVACKTMLERLIAQADEAILRGLEQEKLGKHLKRALAPFVARREWDARSEEGAGDSASGGCDAIAAKGEHLLQDAIRTSVKLGEWYSNEATERWRSGREAEAYRKLIALDYGAAHGTDRDAIIDAHLGAVADAIDAGAVSLIRQLESGQAVLERVWGRPDDPLITNAWGRRLLRRIAASSRPTKIEDLRLECEDAEVRQDFHSLRSMAAQPLGAEGERLLLAYSAQPDGSFNQRDVRFLTAAAVHLDAALQRNDRLEELENGKERLEAALETVSGRLSRTGETAGKLQREHVEMLRAMPDGAVAMLAEAKEAAHLIRDKKVQGRKRADALRLIFEVLESMQDRQRQASERGEKLRARLDALIGEIASSEAELPDGGSGSGRETECEVLNVG